MPEIPDFVRAAMEKAGVDIDKVEAALDDAVKEIEAPDVPDQLVLPPVLPTSNTPDGDPDALTSPSEQMGLVAPDGEHVEAMDGGGTGATSYEWDDLHDIASERSDPF